MGGAVPDPESGSGFASLACALDHQAACPDWNLPAKSMLLSTGETPTSLEPFTAAYKTKVEFLPHSSVFNLPIGLAI